MIKNSSYQTMSPLLRRVSVSAKPTLKQSLKPSMLGIAAVLLVGCESGGSAGEGGGPNVPVTPAEIRNTLLVAQPELQWATCESEPSLECATLLVPMDYSNPQGGTINVEMARTTFTGEAPARAMLMNPGGPGGGGIGFLALINQFGTASDAMRQSTTFVSFDPRGLGLSTPVNCDTSMLFGLNAYPKTAEQLQNNLDVLGQYSTNCGETTGEYLQQLGSFNVVRDMNEMRKAMGLAQIDYLGYSYGTRLGALYMQTYPESTGRFVLDGSMTPDPALAPLIQGGLAPAQANIDRIAEICDFNDALCTTENFSQSLQARVDELAELPPSGEFFLLLFILQFASTQPGFEQLLVGRLDAYLTTLDVENLLDIDRILGLSEGGEGGPGINRATYTAVLCADDFTRPTLDSLTALQPIYNAESDLFAESSVSFAGLCSQWPASVDPIPQIATNQAPASLVIGGPTDAQTPLVFAQDMAQALNGQFLRSEHSGHTTVFTGKNACTDIVVEEFFINGNLPNVSVCEAGSRARSFEWADNFQRRLFSGLPLSIPGSSEPQ